MNQFDAAWNNCIRLTARAAKLITGEYLQAKLDINESNVQYASLAIFAVDQYFYYHGKVTIDRVTVNGYPVMEWKKDSQGQDVLSYIDPHPADFIVPVKLPWVKETHSHTDKLSTDGWGSGGHGLDYKTVREMRDAREAFPDDPDIREEV